LARNEPEAYLWYLEHGTANGSMYQYEENLESKVYGNVMVLGFGSWKQYVSSKHC
jgi:hypothetical protein